MAVSRRFGSVALLCGLLISACSEKEDGPPGAPDAAVGMDASVRDSGPAPSECTGTPPRCETLDADGCEGVDGCAMAQCRGAPVACREYETQERCDGTMGCRWAGTTCTGTAAPCTALDSDTTCAAQMGCAWNAEAACRGEPTACESLSPGQCLDQPGCSLPVDAGPPDAGPDARVSLWDGGGVCNPPEGPSVHVGCNPEDGIECDGDWAGRCEPGCAETECCSPQRNRFMCVPRNEDGSCPAADLWVDTTRVDAFVEYRYFAPGDCAIVEGCVGGPGMRRLLRFDTWTPNTGGADMFLGVPSRDSEYFEYSSCHRHYHFNSYAEYELLTPDGMCVAAEGHKQAFCLLDYYEYPCDGDGSNPDPNVPNCRRLTGYACNNQGIRQGAQDVYSSDLDCQWVDVTDVPAGDYQLRVRINTEHILNEADYSNNEVLVPVTIPTDPGAPAVDISQPCETRETGFDRTCGFTRSYDGDCEPGTDVTVGCSAACGYGSCTGDTIMMVCETAAGVSCTSATAFGTNDDSGCGSGECQGDSDCCSSLTFTCPGTGTYTVWTGAHDTRNTATCEVAVQP